MGGHKCDEKARGTTLGRGTTGLEPATRHIASALPSELRSHIYGRELSFQPTCITHYSVADVFCQPYAETHCVSPLLRANNK